MEDNSSLFSLTIDPVTKSHLLETARWGRFLAIMGFILCVLIVVLGVFFGSLMTRIYNRDGIQPMPAGMNIVMACVYLVIAVIYFFPCLFLFRFSSGIKLALNSNEQDRLNASFENLKSLFRYVGIMTIIILVIYGLILIFAILGFAARG
ncbi:MAG: DUF5362 family protein [Flavisolibacter sp.]